MDTSDLTAFWISFRLAGMTTLFLLVIGTLLAWWLNYSRSRFKIFVEAIVSLPLVLPPTVLGFFLLMLLGNNGPIGKLWFNLTNHTLTFNFTGLLIGSIIYSLPFAVQPLQNAFSSLDMKLCEAAEALGANWMDRFFTIVVPLCKRGFLSAAILGFTHTLGEFGVVLMIGGSIPGETKVISIAIYDHVEELQYHQAFVTSLWLLSFSCAALVLLYMINYRHRSPTHA